MCVRKFDVCISGNYLFLLERQWPKKNPRWFFLFAFAFGKNTLGSCFFSRWYKNATRFAGLQVFCSKVLDVLVKGIPRRDGERENFPPARREQEETKSIISPPRGGYNFEPPFSSALWSLREQPSLELHLFSSSSSSSFYRLLRFSRLRLNPLHWASSTISLEWKDKLGNRLIFCNMD